MPPIAAAAHGGGDLGSGMSVMAHSVVSKRDAMEAAFWRALRVTLAGRFRLHHVHPLHLRGVKPTPFFSLLALSAMIAPSTPAFSAIWRIGSSRARFDLETDLLVGKTGDVGFKGVRGLDEGETAAGDDTGSSTARVADRASSTRCFFSLSSTSVAAPTLMTATPPASLARRSWSFSRS